jgi:hypothetical protein
LADSNIGLFYSVLNLSVGIVEQFMKYISHLKIVRIIIIAQNARRYREVGLS